MRKHAVLLIAGLCACAVAHAADDYNEIFETALDAVEFDLEERWAYTETRIDGEHVWVGRYDPRRSSDEGWEIVSVDGRTPTAKEIEAYQKDKAHDHSGSGDQRADALVEKDSVRLIEENDGFWLFGFTPGEDQEVMNSMDATMRIDKETGQLKYIDIRNVEPIRPGRGVKISKLITRLTFGPAVEDGPVVPLSTQVEVKGRAFLVISFDEEELTRNSDFEFVGDL